VISATVTLVGPMLVAVNYNTKLVLGKAKFMLITF